MSNLKRVVFDTSTLIGAAIRAGSAPDTALMFGFRSWEVWASSETLAELEEVLARKKFDRYLDRDARLEFLALIRSRARVVSAVRSDLSISPSAVAIPRTISF